MVRRFVTSQIPDVGELIRLDEEVSHHLLRVTGIASGEQVELLDGRGVVAVAELSNVALGLATMRILSRKITVPDVRYPIHLRMAQLRANTLDTVLRMVTELGVTDVTIVQTERCVARGDKSERWLRIVRSSAAQCGRADWPRIHPICSFSEALQLPDGVVGYLCDPTATTPLAVADTAASLLVGPEGGWSDAERQKAKEAGWLVRGLGQHVLRADTAAVTAVARVIG